MIYGIGTDIVSIPRIAAALARHGDPFARRILAPREWEEYQALPHHRPQLTAAFLAKRFAAKEAAAKALGTGFSRGITLAGIAVVHDQRGRPGLQFHDAAAAYCRDEGIIRGLLSLSDEKEYALAFATLICQQR
ncbi:holo-ACP synthase [Desulfurivibrio alkaliphilus]|uniref:Holo-[acyl-carrier-protein] synthase n=1 Tax=Desulfurivibrio alkaliphilus (strain DSM 19089 / UNIQEM U267 / AHT2) TaxID=589865 RepID=D6Z2A4_DESAT|nr:holo-ACP synthase [Desulfurivibrio alkaliphilus]ADH85679.1 holo-acyl-carrier-protein synthase [Desulfurivibrio alkaliphilus AHT 2]